MANEEQQKEIEKTDQAIEALIAQIQKDAKKFDDKTGEKMLDLEEAVDNEGEKLMATEAGMNADIAWAVSDIKKADEDIVIPKQDEVEK